MILTVVELDAQCPVDRFGPWLTERSADDPGHPPVAIRTVRAWAGAPVPERAADAGAGLVVLGGRQDAYADDETPWLTPTRALLADAVRAGLPTLGICLGAQLLATATGGCVQVAAPPGREAGVVAVQARPAAATDPLFAHLAEGVVADHPRAGGTLLVAPTMHADAVVELPPGAVWLASSDLYPYQAFRVGEAAWGLQFHAEVSPETFLGWARTVGDVDVADMAAQLAAHARRIAADGYALARAFAAVVAVRATVPA